MFPHQKFYRTIGLCLLLYVPFIESQKIPEIQELMTKDEILKLLHTTPDKIPEHEIVQIEHSLYKRSTPQDFRLKFKAFDKQVDVYLNPNEGILVGEDTPVWIAEYYAHNLRYRKLKQGIMKEVLGVYQSVAGRAALVVRARNERDLHFDGTVEDLSVIPLPPRVQEEIKKMEKNKRELPRTSGSMMTTEYHIVFKTNSGTTQNNTAEQNDEDSSNQSEVIRSKRNDKVVFPTILVTTDFDISVKSQNDSEYYDQLIYQLAFWNGVDLRFRKLTNPRVRLRIAGFILGSGRDTTPYLRKHTVDGKVEIWSAIDDMRDYWNEMRRHDQFSSHAFHIVTTATNLELVGKDPKTGKNLVYGGLTAIAKICFEWDKFYPSVLFKDDHSFGSINVAAHELGHLLGASHDDINKNGCSPDDGYLMAPTTSSTENNLKWSHCSLDAISNTLRTADCTDKPKDKYPPGEPLGKILPGTLKTDHEQCQARGYDYACAATEKICRVLKCYYNTGWNAFSTFWTCQNSPSAADGTECAPGKVCLDGECRSLYPPDNH